MTLLKFKQKEKTMGSVAKGITRMFTAPKMPDVPEYEETPEVDNNETAAKEAHEENKARALASQKSGRKSTILTSYTGDNTEAGISTKRLLGE